MLDKIYNPSACEARIYEAWEKSGAFRARADSESAYTIVIPPPNITGHLHIGHGLNNVIQDILIRYHRLLGLSVLWQPGTDHASIATQMVVERRLRDAGEPSRQALGREEFLRRVWAWKEESGGEITHQLRRLGSSCDWSRERFTMDEGLSRAVVESFVRLYGEGLIYRDKRLVNWDPVMETAISDLEVIATEVRGHLWYFRYPLEGGGEIAVATTRPETMLGDTGIAVHPEDERYRDLIGRFAVHPLTGRRLLIVGDRHADPEQGTGAVKLTPAHDFNDFEVGRRHNLDIVSIMDKRGCMNDAVPEPYRGLDRFAARAAVIEAMRGLGFFDSEVEHVHMVPYGDRGGAPIEPLLTDQWFVDAATLAAPAMAAVRDGRIKFVPQNWTRTYYEWMENIQPWCISRQLWWGHRIPAWYGEDGEIFVADSEAEAYEAARRHYGQEAINLTRDEDVLDTWFSSALWPFSTLDWPAESAALKKHYPTDVLVTAFDIIFFWVARMIMFGLHFMGEEPFRTVYVHALVRDGEGQKMSKSKGNVIDPLDVIDKYGCDALRFTLASLAAPGRDIKLSTEKVESARNFMTKIWNAARFCELNRCTLPQDFAPENCRQDANIWIIRKTMHTESELRKAIECYRFHEAAALLYHFIRGNFCDSYLEICKPILNSDNAAPKAEVQACAAWVFKQILLLLHPFAPFMSEQLWHHLHPHAGMLIHAEWPHYDTVDSDSQAYDRIEWALEAIGAVRSARARLNMGGGRMVPLRIADLAPHKKPWLASCRLMLETMARLENVVCGSDSGEPAVRMNVREATFIIPAAGIIDIAAEKRRLAQLLAAQERDMAQLRGKLENENFTSKAPPAVVAEVHRRLDSAQETFLSLQRAQSMLE